MGARDLLADLAEAGISVEAAGDRLVVRPASKLNDDLRAALRAAKPELLELLTPKSRSSSLPICADCAHVLRHGTCSTPVEAGLIRADYSIVWPTAGYAKTCSAFELKPVTVAPDRPYRLTPAQADDAHAEPWDEVTCADTRPAWPVSFDSGSAAPTPMTWPSGCTYAMSRSTTGGCASSVST